MESSTTSNKPKFLKRQFNKLNSSTHEFMLELSIIATILFCLNFWGNLPDLGIDPVWGRGIAAIGMLIIFCMIAFRFKWPLILGLASMVIYLGISHLQTNEPNVVQDGKKEQLDNPKQKENNPFSVSTYYHKKDSIK